jgi:putative hydrolase of the HAD superfamily
LIRAVLFDAAGTLVELREPVGETYARLAREQGVALSAWRVSDAFQRVFARAEPMVFPDAAPQAIPGLERDWWRRVVRSTFLAADSSTRFSDFDAYFERLWGRFSDPAAWALRAGGRELLERLRLRGIRSAVVSNFDRRLPGILEGLGLAALLDAIVLPSDAGASKPDRRIFALALERLGVAPEHALFVGDDAGRDLAGARAAGLQAVEVASLATLSALRLPGDPEGER